MAILANVAFSLPGGRKGFQCFITSVIVEGLLAVMFFAVWLPIQRRKDRKNDKLSQSQVTTEFNANGNDTYNTGSSGGAHDIEFKGTSGGESADSVHSDMDPRAASYNTEFKFPASQPSQKRIRPHRSSRDHLRVLDPGAFDEGEEQYQLAI